MSNRWSIGQAAATTYRAANLHASSVTSVGGGRRGAVLAPCVTPVSTNRGVVRSDNHVARRRRSDWRVMMGKPAIDPRSSTSPRRFADRVAALIDAVKNAPGPLAAERRAVVLGEPLPGLAGLFVDKVRLRAYAVTDDDVDTLRRHGLDEDAIFELVIASAVGEAAARLRAGLRAIGHDA